MTQKEHSHTHSLQTIKKQFDKLTYTEKDTLFLHMERELKKQAKEPRNGNTYPPYTTPINPTF